MRNIGASELISDAYRETLRAKLRRSPQWGGTAFRQAPWVIEEMAALPEPVGSILDYGSGNGSLLTKLSQMRALTGIEIYEYDPGRGTALPHYFEQADLTTCIDVMEHVEEDKVDAVFADIRDKTRRCALFLVSTVKAIHRLPGGQNAHITVRPIDWWMDQLQGVFPVVETVAAESSWFKARCLL